MLLNCCLLFLTFSVLVANPKKLLYTVANPARGLLNREKNPKNNYSPALQEDARRFEVRLNGVSARQFGIKDMLDGHAGVEDFFGGIVWEVTRVV